MRTCLAFLLVVVGTHLAAAPANSANSDENLSDSGNAFVRTCSAIENTSGTLSTYQQMVLETCAGYLMGLSDGIKIERSYADARGKGAKAAIPYCLADVYEVEQGQKVRILLKYIRNNPAKAHMVTAGLFIFAMGETFPPCPERK
jgi:Rap1a immunity proteins